MEDELMSWAAHFETAGQFNRPPREQDALQARATQLRVLGQQIHRLADDMGQMPLRQRELVARALDKSRD